MATRNRDFGDNHAFAASSWIIEGDCEHDDVWIRMWYVEATGADTSIKVCCKLFISHMRFKVQ